MDEEKNYKEMGRRIRALLKETHELLRNDDEPLITSGELGKDLSEHYSAILENVREGIVISKVNDIIYVNLAAQNMTGYSLDELKDMNPFKLLHPDDIDKVSEIFEKRNGNFKPNSFSTRIFTKAGQLLWLDINTWHTHIGDEPCAIDFVQDVTEKREKELELKEYRRRLQLALEATNDGLWDVNVETGETWVNSRWFEMLGYDPGEIEVSNSRWMDLIHPDDFEYVKSARLERHNSDKTYNEMEFRLLTKTGEYRWVLSRGRTVEWDQQGLPKRIIGTHIDITDFKRTSELLSLQRDIAVKLSQSSNMETALSNILDGLIKVEGVECCGIYLKEGDNFILKKHRGLSRRFAEHVRVSNPPENIIDKFRNGSSFYTPYMRLHDDNDSIRVNEGIQCLGITPIMKENAILGLINVGSKTRSMIPLQSRNVVEYLTAHISLVMSRLITEEKIRESERHYRTLFSANPVGVGLTDMEGHLLDNNQALISMFGYTEDDKRTMNIEQIYKNSRDRERVITLLKESGTVERREIDFIRKDGSLMTGRLTARSILKDGKRLFLALVEDITEEKKYLQRIESSEHKNRAILAAIPDMIFRFDIDGNILEFKAARDFAPYTSPQKFMGRRICDVLPHDVCEKIMEQVRLSLSSGRTVNIVYDLDIEGKKHTYEGRIASLDDSEGIIIIRDITELRNIS